MFNISECYEVDGVFARGICTMREELSESGRRIVNKSMDLLEYLQERCEDMAEH